MSAHHLRVLPLLGGRHRQPAAARRAGSAVAATAPQRAGEPAWHRRARRRRGDARALLRVAAASQLLDTHHSRQNGARLAGAAMPNGAARGKGAGGSGGGGGNGGKGTGGEGSGQDGGRWTCRICRLSDNFSWRTRCRGCEAYRVRGEGGPLAAFNPRGQSLAERQVQQQRQAQRQQRAASAAERKLQAEVERLQQQLAAKQPAPRGGRTSAGDDDGEDCEMDIEEADAVDAYATWTEDERRQQIDAARASLPYLVGKHGEASGEAASVREEIAALENASRDAKPFTTHRAMLERRRDKLRAKIKRDEEELAKAEKECEELKERINNIRTETADHNRDLAAVEEELAGLIKKALAEGDAAGDAGKPEDDSAAPWSAQAASATLHALATRPGVPPEFATLLLHVHQAAAAMVAAAAAAQPQTRQGGATDATTKPPAASPAERAGGTATTDATSSGKGGQQQQQQLPQRQQSDHLHQQQGEAAAAVAATGAAAAASTQGAAMAPSGGEGTGGAPTAPAAPARTESDEELVEEDRGGAMECDVEETLRKLPEKEQARLRAAIRRGGWRGRARDEGDAGGGAGRGREDRERSPRPTKQNEGEL